MKLKVDTSPVSDLRIIRTRDALRHALLTLLEQKPLDQIGVRDITTVARVGYATFYRHYPTKEALLEDLAKDQVDHLVSLALPIMDRANSLAAYTAIFSHVNDHRALWTTLLTGGAAGIIKQELLRVSRQVTAERLGIDNCPAADLKVILLVTCTVELLAWWLSQPNPLTVEEVAKILDGTVISLDKK